MALAALAALLTVVRDPEADAGGVGLCSPVRARDKAVPVGGDAGGTQLRCHSVQPGN